MNICIFIIHHCSKLAVAIIYCIRFRGPKEVGALGPGPLLLPTDSDHNNLLRNLCIFLMFSLIGLFAKILRQR